LATGGAALCGALLGAPTLRLRGDYLALVTLGFGEVVKYAIQNLTNITDGTRGLTNLPPPMLFGFQINPDEFRWYYYITLVLLTLSVLLLRNLERSSLGRSWMAIREDELAATCMGINAARVKLAAFALGSGLAGLAGCLYAVKQTTTAGPNTYDFNLSVITLCCVILGGLGSIRGTLLGVLLLQGFDKMLTPLIDDLLQRANINPTGSAFLSLSGWRLMVFGLALILMMRFRPEGLLPAGNIKAELHRGDAKPSSGESKNAEPQSPSTGSAN
jgi:branched-chain amino acid transport system permease protein